ncbi:hypothetical protein GCM10022223_61390 [Kineosporia mesophila]|uniref:Uncharacterized protein n=1 Tax=Kineosporia mesophila TaxID=566012 RepID=A0ABP7AKB5_9ACTN|nr:hypothetical protein [Kineosporia mesophila]MCD5354047.1 hypothetical protein [Kineosporia mesophila]
MPRTVQEILDHADELAARFEKFEPASSDAREADSLEALREAVLARSDAERALAVLVRQAHASGHSWRSIGDLLGTSGEAARQRYGKRDKRSNMTSH